MEYKYVFNSESYYQLNMIKDKKISWKTQPKNIIIFNLKIGYSNKRFTTTNINQNPLDQQINN